MNILIRWQFCEKKLNGYHSCSAIYTVRVSLIINMCQNVSNIDGDVRHASNTHMHVRARRPAGIRPAPWHIGMHATLLGTAGLPGQAGPLPTQGRTKK